MLIFWTPLVCISCLYLSREIFHTLFPCKENFIYSNIPLFLPALFVCCAPIVGWIADTRCGNYRVFRAGVILLLLATIVACICSLVLQSVDLSECNTVSRVFSYGISPVVFAMAVVGVTTYIVTAVQLGLDQMPDASSANITSFITWFVFSLILGIWLYNSATNVLPVYTWISFSQVSIIFPVILMSVVCCSLFLLGPKWLIIEPNCPQSLKTVYHVLKFAWKHKAPLNRSALTYWEEDVPSRMDLGKSRYGGPFTTEQVEDVKTFFKILIVFLPIFLSSSSFLPDVLPLWSSGLVTKCDEYLVFSFTYNPFWIMIIALLVYEFLIYPFIKNRLPSILKRIGILSFLLFIFNSIKLIIAVSFFYLEHFSQWYSLVYSVPLCCVFVFLLNDVLEFVCAQAPYKMRGLLLGYVIFLYIISLVINITVLIFGSESFRFSIRLSSVYTALSVIGFVLYCLLARWYKMRVRDEEYDVHRVVEEVYDRYLSQRHSMN